jgi:tetratricopeptide (TPR) repeat protein
LGTDPDGHAHALECLGRALTGLGRPEQALEHYRRALELCEQRGNHFTRVTTLRHAATAHRALGRNAAARTALQQAIALLQHLAPEDAAAVREQLGTLPPDPTRSTSG